MACLIVENGQKALKEQQYYAKYKAAMYGQLFELWQWKLDCEVDHAEDHCYNLYNGRLHNQCNEDRYSRGWSLMQVSIPY